MSQKTRSRRSGRTVWRLLVIMLSLTFALTTPSNLVKTIKSQEPQASRDLDRQDELRRKREREFADQVNRLLGKAGVAGKTDLNVTDLTSGQEVNAPQVAVGTPLALIGAAQMIITALSNLGTDLGSTGKLVSDNAATQLSILSREFESKVGKDLSVPLENLSFEIQSLGTQISNATFQLNTIIETQRNCAAQDFNVFLSGLRTITSQLKEGIFFARKDQPRLEFFQFTGHNHSIVPAEGGRVTVFGFDIWKNRELPPTIAILTEQGAQIATLTAEPGANKDQVVMPIEPSLIKNNIGKCLVFAIQPRRKEGFGGKVKTYDFHLPFCIPDTEAASLILAATISYSCPTTDEGVWRTDLAQNFFQQNTRCEGRATLSQPPKVLNVGENCEIVDVKWDATDLNRRALSASATFTKTSVSVSGELDEPRCACAFPVGCTFISSSVWNYIVTPKVRCTFSTSEGASTTFSDKVKMGNPETQLTVELTKSCKFNQSDFEYQILRVMPGAEPTEIFRSRRLSCGSNGCPSETATNGSMIINAAYTPGVATGTAQVSAKITIPRCGF